MNVRLCERVGKLMNTPEFLHMNFNKRESIPDIVQDAQDFNSLPQWLRSLIQSTEEKYPVKKPSAG